MPSYSAIKAHGSFAAPTETDRPAVYSLTTEGWNTVTKNYWLSSSDPVVSADTYFPRGFPLTGFANMFVDEVSIDQQSTNIFQFTVNAKGLLSPQPHKKIIDTRTETFSSPVADVPGGSSDVRVEGRYALLTVAVIEVLVDQSPAQWTNQVGTSSPSLPDDMPTPPTNPWTLSSATPVYRYPSGWILERLNYEKITGCNIFLSRRDFAYWPTFLPG